MKKKEKKSTSIYLDKDIYIKIRYIAAGKDIKFNDTIIEALKDYINKNKKYIPM